MIALRRKIGFGVSPGKTGGRRSDCPQLASKHGFTLLEVLLALGLSVVLIACIAMAIRVHLTTLSKQQKDIESKQIARSVLMMITNDIRSAMQYRAQDFSSLENLQLSEAMILGIAGSMNGDDSAGGDAIGGDLAGAGSDMLGGADGAGGAGGAGASGGTGGAATGDENAEAPAFGDPAAEDCVSCRPTLLGTLDFITVDVSRLPRVDEYNPLIASQTDAVQLPSDVKSVAYFVSDSAPANNNSLFARSASSANGGLYRRQMDRAVAAYVSDEGGKRVDAFAKLVSAEVAFISLRYFDGDNWVEEWDSEAAGGFPPAVEVVLVIDPARTDENTTNYQYSGFDRDTMQMYRSVIHLPTAELGGG